MSLNVFLQSLQFCQAQAVNQPIRKLLTFYQLDSMIINIILFQQLHCMIGQKIVSIIQIIRKNFSRGFIKGYKKATWAAQKRQIVIFETSKTVIYTTKVKIFSSMAALANSLLSTSFICSLVIKTSIAIYNFQVSPLESN